MPINQRMKTTNPLVSFAVCLIFFAMSACQQKTSDKFSVTINYKNADKMVRQFFNGRTDTAQASGAKVIKLEVVSYEDAGGPVVLDSAKLGSSNGSVTLKGKSTEETIFQVIVENGPVMLLVNDANDVTVDLDLAKRDGYYTVSGSDASNELRTFIQDYSEKSFVVNKSLAELDSLKRFGAADSLTLPATDKKNASIQSLNSYLKTVIGKTTHPSIELFALGMSSRSFQKSEFETMLNAAVKKFPENKTLAIVKTNYEMQQQQAQQQEAASDMVWTGKQVPELSLPDQNGKLVSISSFRGKYLLVDFWASWCGPCMEEMPNVVNAYNTFKNKNFAILGVSLDKDKVSWMNAITAGKLGWTHISDLKFWNSQAVSIFQFNGIPYNILVDPQGKVIAESLRGEALQSKLASVLQ
jgi:peroxiredoxin